MDVDTLAFLRYIRVVDTLVRVAVALARCQQSQSYTITARGCRHSGPSPLHQGRRYTGPCGRSTGTLSTVTMFKYNHWPLLCYIRVVDTLVRVAVTLARCQQSQSYTITGRGYRHSALLRYIRVVDTLVRVAVTLARCQQSQSYTITGRGCRHSGPSPLHQGRRYTGPCGRNTGTLSTVTKLHNHWPWMSTLWPFSATSGS